MSIGRARPHPCARHATHREHVGVAQLLQRLQLLDGAQVDARLEGVLLEPLDGDDLAVVKLELRGGGGAGVARCMRS